MNQVAEKLAVAVDGRGNDLVVALRHRYQKLLARGIQSPAFELRLPDGNSSLIGVGEPRFTLAIASAACTPHDTGTASAKVSRQACRKSRHVAWPAAGSGGRKTGADSLVCRQRCGPRASSRTASSKRSISSSVV